MSRSTIGNQLANRLENTGHMRHLASAALLLALPIAAHGAPVPRDRCDNRPPLTPEEIATNAEVMAPATTFGDAKITCKSSRDGWIRRERGTFNGILYRAYYGKEKYGEADGSIREWTVKCEVDTMTDAKLCSVSAGNLHAYWKGDHWSLHVAGSRMPGSAAVVRIDDAAAVSTTGKFFSRAQSKDIAAALHSGTRARTRYTEWPRGINRDDEFDPAGFAEAVELMMWIRGALE